MTTPLTPEAIAQNPDGVTETITFACGERITFRLLRPEDAELLGRYFLRLSEETRRRFGPHPFTMEQAQKLCAEINYYDTLRLIAVTEKGGQPQVIAYFILQLGIKEAEKKRYQAHGMVLDECKDCTFAPSVADAYQNRGLGSTLMPKILDLARRFGFQRMVLMGGTQATNYRAIHFYEKFGFRKVGDFLTKGGVNNHDMILAL